MRRMILPLILLAGIAMLMSASSAQACGGFFCTNVPVDQSAERIIFAVNEAAGTIDAYVQINYTGSPEQFAWVVPVPNPPKVDVADIATINELDGLTRPNYIAPPMPDDCPVPVPAAGGGDGVTVFGQGSVGPYDYAIVGSSDPQALVQWLRTNGYQITPAMEPLVDVYVKEKMDFLAMKLQPKKEVKDIQPVKMTYKSSKPMIPLRLTAVAANPDMAVVTWIFAKGQAEPENYAKIAIPDDQIVFGIFSSTNYTSLVSQAADQHSGQAFVTEFAGPTKGLGATDPTLSTLLRQYPYLTRVYTRLSPEEMTVDPVFRFNPELPSVSNVHDLSKDARVWDCKGGNIANRALTPAETAAAAVVTPIATAVAGLAGSPPATASNFAARYGLLIVLIGLGLLVIGLTAGLLIGRRR
jgi:hypothetical protein